MLLLYSERTKEGNVSLGSASRRFGGDPVWTWSREIGMRLEKLGDVELEYTKATWVDVGEGASRFYGHMRGSISGERLTGDLDVTNLAPMRADNVNTPMMRGIFTATGGAQAWVELDGIATEREGDEARVFVTLIRFQTADEALGWLNTVFGVIDGLLDIETGVARGELLRCWPSVGLTSG